MTASDSGTSGDRERLVAQAVAEIGGGAGGDAIGAADALVRWSMRLLDVSGAGVMLADEHGRLRSFMVSSDAVRVLEAAELDRGSGPCVESHRTAAAVIHADVDVVDDRWPHFGPSAQAGGVRAAHAIPMLGGDTAIGVLNLFRATPGGLPEADGALATTLAGAVAETMSKSPAGGRVRADELTTAVGDAAILERAKGMLAARLRIDIGTASSVLRHVARERGYPMGAVAAEVVAGTADITLPLSVTPPPDATGTD
jgi:GAF domain-containing protein